MEPQTSFALFGLTALPICTLFPNFKKGLFVLLTGFEEEVEPPQVV